MDDGDGSVYVRFRGSPLSRALDDAEDSRLLLAGWRWLPGGLSAQELRVEGMVRMSLSRLVARESSRGDVMVISVDMTSPHTYALDGEKNGCGS